MACNVSKASLVLFIKYQLIQMSIRSYTPTGAVSTPISTVSASLHLSESFYFRHHDRKVPFQSSSICLTALFTFYKKMYLLS